MMRNASIALLVLLHCIRLFCRRRNTILMGIMLIYWLILNSSSIESCWSRNITNRISESERIWWNPQTFQLFSIMRFGNWVCFWKFQYIMFWHSYDTVGCDYFFSALYFALSSWKMSEKVGMHTQQWVPFRDIKWAPWCL